VWAVATDLWCWGNGMMTKSNRMSLSGAVEMDLAAETVGKPCFGLLFA